MKTCISVALGVSILYWHPSAEAVQLDCLYRVVRLVNQASEERPPGEESLAEARRFYPTQEIPIIPRRISLTYS